MFTWNGTKFGPSTKRFATVVIRFSVCVAFVSWIVFLFHRWSIQLRRDTRLFRKMKWFLSSFLKPQRKWKNVPCILRFVWLINALFLFHSWGNKKRIEEERKNYLDALDSASAVLHIVRPLRDKTCSVQNFVQINFFVRKCDVPRYYWQRWFLAQHTVAMLEQCCNYSKQRRNNVATLCCAKNRCCESSRVLHRTNFRPV